MNEEEFWCLGFGARAPAKDMSAARNEDQLRNSVNGFPPHGPDRGGGVEARGKMLPDLGLRVEVGENSSGEQRILGSRAF